MNVSNVFNIAKSIFHDKFIKNHPVYENEAHIKKAIDWLSLAQDSTKDDGVSEGYHLYHGWLASYPETTGYIIETFFDYYHDINSDELIKSRAIRMADWLLSVQKNDGSIPDSYFKKTMVFDTGQVVFGFVRTFEETKDVKYREAAIKAADWLIEQQEPSGEWVKHAADNISHTYYSRVAWSLLKVHGITLDDKYKEACVRNIDWCLKQQDENGWFNNASFNLRNHYRPFTHTIAYTLRGILESGLYLSNEKYISAVKVSLDELMGKLPVDGFVCGTYGNEWSGDHTYSCLTGNMQLAIILNKLYMETGNINYHRHAVGINKFTKSKHVTGTKNANLSGALAGSFPVWGDYIHYCYPNWAAKFMVESLMIESVALNYQSKA